MAPGWVGRAMKPHDCASWLRGSLKAHPCTCSELAESIRPPCGRFLRQLADPKRGVRQKTVHPQGSDGFTQRIALRAVDLHPVSGRRVGGEKAHRVARRDSGQFGVSAGMRCRQTPEPACIVVRLHRTTDPPRAHLLVTFLCEQKSDSRAGRREKRLTSLGTVPKSKSKWVPACPAVRLLKDAGLRRQDAVANIGIADGPEGTQRNLRVMTRWWEGGTEAGPSSPTLLPAGEGRETSRRRRGESRVMRDAPRAVTRVAQMPA